MRMSFELALAYAKQGKKIRRAIFDEGVFYTVKHGRLIAYGDDWCLHGWDLCAEDWEVVE